MKFKAIILSIVIITIALNVLVLSQTQLENKDSLLELLTATQSRISEIPVLSGFNDKTLLENEIEELDKIFES